uniref:Uncharacterized protein n=1 Tax=Leersia perrieri TaxID=77586 RepID=A0A0D9W457_9ORYZ
MENKAATAVALLLLLAVVAVAAAGSAALPASYNYKDDAAPAPSNASWVEDAVGIFPAEPPAEMMLVTATAASGGDDREFHRRGLAGGGGYINPSVVSTMVRCFRSRCQGKGGSYTGRGNQCYFQNQACRK